MHQVAVALTNSPLNSGEAQATAAGAVVVKSAHPTAAKAKVRRNSQKKGEAQQKTASDATAASASSSSSAASGSASASASSSSSASAVNSGGQHHFPAQSIKDNTFLQAHGEKLLLNQYWFSADTLAMVCRNLIS
jgi:hypothetical protein